MCAAAHQLDLVHRLRHFYPWALELPLDLWKNTQQAEMLARRHMGTANVTKPIATLWCALI
jgi:hypothetical protein